MEGVGVGSCSRLVRQVNSTRSSALPLPAGRFLARKSRRWCHHRDGFSERMYIATTRRSPLTCDRLSLMESYRTGKTRRRDRRAVSLVKMRSGDCVRSERSAAPSRRRILVQKLKIRARSAAPDRERAGAISRDDDSNGPTAMPATIQWRRQGAKGDLARSRGKEFEGLRATAGDGCCCGKMPARGFAVIHQAAADVFLSFVRSA